MRLVRDPVSGEVDLTASAEEPGRLADAVADGEGLLTASPSPGDEVPPGDETSPGDEVLAEAEALAGVEVRKSAGPGVLIRLDPERRILVISGDPAGRAVLADNLSGMASAQGGGHLHIDHHPGHFYLAEGSVPVVVSSPHGGMPTH